MRARTATGLAFERTGNGPALLLLHAGIADMSMWEPQWRSWRERFTLVRYDARGIGGSEDPALPTPRTATRSRSSTRPESSGPR